MQKRKENKATKMASVLIRFISIIRVPIPHPRSYPVPLCKKPTRQILSSLCQKSNSRFDVP
jgi:hypothetical protein